ncbi:MAG: hypothetical protein SWN98_03910 [Pseudomonadota bacterium]|jgi:hypothetical protein|nr:hypothetical protein [Pseudomonadota bacterium]
MKPLLAVCVAVALLAGCAEKPTPRALPEVMPDYHNTTGNLVLGDPATPGQFEVISRPGDGARNYWCAAGEYVENKLRLLPNERIYVVESRRPSLRRPGHSGVVFTVRPDEALLAAAEARPESDYSLSTDVGENFLSALASSTCRSITPFYWDLDAF